jgi:hypothetical protein
MDTCRRNFHGNSEISSSVDVDPGVVAAAGQPARPDVVVRDEGFSVG